MATSWIVLWFRGNRVGSFENTPENLAEIKAQFYTQEIQTDTSGTLHLDIFRG